MTLVTSLCSDVIKYSPNVVSVDYGRIAKLITTQFNSTQVPVELS